MPDIWKHRQDEMKSKVRQSDPSCRCTVFMTRLSMSRLRNLCRLPVGVKCSPA
jgi:hypothetical protein